jgi:hypothetical protein
VDEDPLSRDTPPFRGMHFLGLLKVLKGYALLFLCMVTISWLGLYYVNNISKPSTPQKIIWDVNKINSDVQRTSKMFETIKREVRRTFTKNKEHLISNVPENLSIVRSKGWVICARVLKAVCP